MPVQPERPKPSPLALSHAKATKEISKLLDAALGSIRLEVWPLRTKLDSPEGQGFIMIKGE